MSQVEGLVEPLEVQDPRDSLTQNPEVVAEQQTTQNIDRVSGTGYQHENRCNNYCQHCPERQLHALCCLEFQKDNHHEA